MTTVCKTVLDDTDAAAKITEQLPATLGRCDELRFDRPEEAIAYAVWHLSDRYGRVTQALDELVAVGHLPVRRTRMSVLEVGSGPAPAIYAAAEYYSRLAEWAEKTDQPFAPSPVTHVHTVERGAAWGPFLHHLSEVMHSAPDEDRRLPFGVTYEDLRGFFVKREHMEGIARAVRLVRAEADMYEDYVSDHDARMLGLQEGHYPPGAYDLIVMCNFLTNERITESFATEIAALGTSLTPGGVLLALGNPSAAYEPIWDRLAKLLGTHGSTPSRVIDKTVRAHVDPRAQTVVAEQIIDCLYLLRASAPGAFAEVTHNLPKDVQTLDVRGIRFPNFRIVAYKNEKPRSRRNVSQ